MYSFMVEMEKEVQNHLIKPIDNIKLKKECTKIVKLDVNGLLNFDEINVHAAKRNCNLPEGLHMVLLRSFINLINHSSGCRQNLQSSSRVRRCITSNGDDISVGALAVALIFM